MSAVLLWCLMSRILPSVVMGVFVTTPIDERARMVILLIVCSALVLRERSVLLPALAKHTLDDPWERHDEFKTMPITKRHKTSGALLASLPARSVVQRKTSMSRGMSSTIGHETRYAHLLM